MPKLSKLLALMARATYRKGLRAGVGAAIEHSAFLQNARFATILDAGANKGQFALAARAAMPAARIISFEPLAAPAAVWKKVFAGDGRASLAPIALGASPGEQTIHISRRADSSSLLPIGKLQSQIFPDTEEVGTETIRVETLDAFLAAEELQRPTLLKIDVQGFEMQLLEGACGTLSSIDSIYVELSFASLYDGQALADAVIDWLRLRGFRLAGIYNLSSDAAGRSIQADFHFQRINPA